MVTFYGWLKGLDRKRWRHFCLVEVGMAVVQTGATAGPPGAARRWIC